MKQHRSKLTRRGFLAGTGAGVSLPYLLPSGVLAAADRPGANDRLTVAHIGVGGMGGGHLQRMTKFREEGKVNIAAVCDVDEGRLANAAKVAGPGVDVYRDYRSICLRDDIDAVVIGTPDHWHAVQTVHACETGKHVFVEKPSSVTVEEGRAMVTAARENQCAVQVGAQGRTGWGAYYTCRAIRNGIVGKVDKVTCWHYANPVGGLEPDSEPPPGLDWDLWLGPMRGRPYNQAYLPGTFRWFLESGGGQIRDRGAHQFSTILWCMDADGPRNFTVEATGTPPPKGLWDCPVDMHAEFHFQDPEWTLIWAQPGDKRGKLEFGNVFWGEDDDYLILEWEGAYKPAEPRAMNFQVPPGGYEPYRTNEYPNDFNMNHMADWMKAIREPDYLPAVDIEIGHRTATLCIVANLSYILGRKLEWDADNERVVGDEQANRLLGQPQRHPYHL
jgi:predicted dehydrogenase